MCPRESTEYVIKESLLDQIIDALPTAVIGGVVIPHPAGPLIGVVAVTAADVAAQRGAIAALKALEGTGADERYPAAMEEASGEDRVTP